MAVSHAYVLPETTDEHEQVRYHRRFTPDDRVTIHHHGHVPPSALGNPPRELEDFCYARGCYSLVPLGRVPVPPEALKAAPKPAPAATKARAQTASQEPSPSAAGVDPREDWHGEQDHPGPWTECDRCTYRLRTGKHHPDDPPHGGKLEEKK